MNSSTQKDVIGGGNISPGIYTRFKALSACCDKLPLIEKGGDLPEFGYSTETAIRAGVIKGMVVRNKRFTLTLTQRIS